MRQILAKNHFGHKKGTRWRGHDVQRIEAFTDAVFAFAITLLAVSLEVPKSFNELMEAMKGFIGFTVTFTFLFYVWYQHYNFFRKYGIDDRTIIILNGLFLLAVLFFIFPFKFISYLLVTMIFDFNDEALHRIMRIHDMPQLLALYFLGLTVLLLSFALMYRHALKYRFQLELNEEEQYEALRRYAGPLLVILLLVLGIILYLVLPEQFTWLTIVVLAPIRIISRLLKKKKIKIDWLIPNAANAVEEAEEVK